MLSWTQRDDGWYADGFRIELRAPFHWVLVDLDADEPARVSTDLEPLAVEKTLSECKREAEILVSARHRSALRRKHLRILLLVVAGSVLLLGQTPTTNVLVVLLAGFIVARSLGVIVGSFTPNILGAPHEVFYS